MNELYYIVNKKVLPSVFEKVVYAKKLLNSSKCSTVSEAVKRAGISRSVFYKYRDNVSVFVEKQKQDIITLNLLLLDEIGVLSNILKLLASSGASILTINQNIPIDDIAPVSISLTTAGLKCSTEKLVKSIEGINGVLRIDLVAKE